MMSMTAVVALATSASGCGPKSPPPDQGTVTSVEKKNTTKGTQFLLHVRLDKGRETIDGPYFDLRNCRVGARWPSCYQK